MEKMRNTWMRNSRVILILLAAVFAQSITACAKPAPANETEGTAVPVVSAEPANETEGTAVPEASAEPAGKAEDASAAQTADDTDHIQLQLGSSRYSVSIPRAYRNGEVTIEEVQANQVAYYFSPDSEMDFDIYQFHRPETEMTLEEYTKKTAADFNGRDAQTKMINGIEVGTYLSREVYEGIEYDVMTALIEDDGDYIEVVFWLDGRNAGQEASEILSTLSEVQTYDLNLGTLPFCMSVPVDYSLGEETIEDDAEHRHSWYYFSENSPLDFDVYQWGKEGNTLEKYAIEEARAYEAESVDYRTVNNVYLAYYHSFEEYEGLMYPVSNYLFEDGNYFMKISFWLDGEIAVRQADRIISTLRRTDG